ncbi:MAG: hypothetical protein R2705_16090 [Ilumatobacteraceae bacterium]
MLEAESISAGLDYRRWAHGALTSTRSAALDCEAVSDAEVIEAFSSSPGPRESSHGPRKSARDRLVEGRAAPRLAGKTLGW